MTRLNQEIPDSVNKQLKRMAVERGESKKDLVVEALEGFVDQQ